MSKPVTRHIVFRMEQDTLISGQIKVLETVHPEVYVEFGNKSLYVDTKRSAMAYKFNGNEVVERGIQSGEG